ncbi:MAG: hypothetical protein JNG88_02710 [Phycisphaerales bacterium]|nr:hypothetical protein [Phycisphaerales bacterium]
MFATSTRRRTLLTATLGSSAIIALFFPVLTYGDDDDGRRRDQRIVHRSHRVDDRTYAEWTAAWWQWATSFDLASNPILDADGSQATNGQSGPMWFLAGTFGGSAVRNVTIPANKHLLVPIINGEWDTVPGFSNPLGLPDPLSVDDIRAIVAFGINGADISCEIDNRQVSNLRSFRVRSPVFSMNMNSELASAFGYPVPYVRTAVSDGYWLIIKPLSAGQHTIHFAASNAATGFALDVTYNITVEE